VTTRDRTPCERHAYLTPPDPNHRHNPAEDGPVADCDSCRPDQYPPYPPMAHPSPRTHAHIADPDKYRALRARIAGMAS
jgi:hypothetical protein